MQQLTTKHNTDGTQSLTYQNSFFGHFSHIDQNISSDKRVVTIKTQSYSATLTWYKQG